MLLLSIRTLHSSSLKENNSHLKGLQSKWKEERLQSPSLIPIRRLFLNGKRLYNKLSVCCTEQTVHLL